VWRDSRQDAAPPRTLAPAPPADAPPHAAEQAAANPPPPPFWQIWVRSKGGLVTGPEKDRVAFAARRIITSDFKKPITLGVLDTDEVGGYAFPDGAIFLTRGLLDELNDDELAAAIAHEMGHLIDGHHTGAAGLNGPTLADPGCEIRADAIGVELLARAGIPKISMITMLLRVETSANIQSACRAGIRERIDILRGQ